ncbi:MAG: class I SAM-dependent methyltransferase [Sumerlaeia bacterium]
MSQRKPSPQNDPRDPAWRPPLDRSLPWPPEGAVDHPNLKELLYANLTEGQTVVDVGCGTGPFVYEDFAPRFIAFDMFEPDNRDGLKAGRDEFRLGKLDAFPIEDASVDAVVLGFILEHVEKPEAFLREAERVLKPGGWCYVAIPNGYSLEDRLFRLATKVAGSQRGPHIQRFSFDSFRALAEENTGLRFQAWHLLRASWMWMAHPKLRWARGPWLGLLRAAGVVGVDGFAGANFQVLLKKN